MMEYVVEVILQSGQKWVRSFATQKDAEKWVKDFKKKHKNSTIRDLRITSNEREIEGIVEKMVKEIELLKEINEKRFNFMNDFGFSRAYLKEDTDFEEIKRLEEIEKIEDQLKNLK